MKYVLALAAALVISGCVASPWSDWQRFSAGSYESTCSTYADREKVRCIADAEGYEKSARACTHSVETFGADYARCMNRNKAIWTLYSDNYLYQAARYNRNRVIDQHYRDMSSLWNPICINAAGDNVDCE